MASMEEWEESVESISDKTLKDIGEAIDTLTQGWGLFSANYPEMRVLRKIVEFESKLRFTRGQS